MNKSINIYLKLTLEQKQLLDSQSKISNWLYNHLLEFVNEHGLPSKYDLRNLVFKIKEEYPFVKSLFSSCYKNVSFRLHNAFVRFFKKQNDHPHFRSWQKNWFSLYYEEANKGIKVKDDTIVISFGKNQDGKRLKFTCKLTEKLPKNFTFKTARICKNSQGYYVSFVGEVEEPKQKPIIRTCTIDPNHKNFCQILDSSGNSITLEKLEFIKYWNEKIDELISKRDKCKRKSKKILLPLQKGEITQRYYYEPSRRWQRYNLALIKARNCLQEQKKQAVYSLAHMLCRGYDEILIGDYDPTFQGQAFHKNAHDAHRTMVNNSLIGQIRHVLTWVTAKSGKLAKVIDEAYTTKTCVCGTKNEALTPNDRSWTCDNCQRTHVRDELACRNILLWHSAHYENKLRCSRLYEEQNLRRCTFSFSPHDGVWLKDESNKTRDRVLSFA